MSVDCGCGYDWCPDCNPTSWEQYATCGECGAPRHPGFRNCAKHGGRDRADYAPYCGDTDNEED